jgi:hypothetical protein
MNAMENIEVIPQTVVDRKTSILKSRLDPEKARLIGEEQKTNLFLKFGFLKPKSDDISLIGFTKYYEPFIFIGGKYSIDYCKKHVFEIKANNQMEKVFIGGTEFKFEPLSATDPSRVLKLVAEEHSHYENKTYFILDRLMREIAPEKIPLAPFENEMENLDNFDIDFRKDRISLEEEINFIRSKIVKRPSDADTIVKEMFEITERLTVYNPIYELSFQNVKNAKEVTILIDGITGKLTIAKFTKVTEKVGPSEKVDQKKLNIKTRFFRENPKKETLIDTTISNEHLNSLDQNRTLEKEISAPPISEADSKFEVNNAITLATDLLKRLGFKNKIEPLKVSQDGELHVVDLSVENKVAKVVINTKTKEVKEYEIQELNSSY